MKKWRNFQEKHHSPMYSNWDVHFTSGAMEGCSKLFDMLVDDGDAIMVQSPTYTGVLGAVSFQTLSIFG